MKDSNNQLVFFELLRAGLWGVRNPDEWIDETTGWQGVYLLATEQSALGLILAGLEHSDVKPPKELLLQWIGEVQAIEHRNKAMNAFVASLIERLRAEDVYTILVKGQGIAQCYERPLWRACGDVDLFLSEDNYKKALQILSPLASSIEEEYEYKKHLAMTIDGWSVELHGTLRSGLWQSLDRGLDKAQNAVFYEGKVRSWMNGRTQVFLPAADEDVVFVFAHILQHFFMEGIGLRQICDWCRLLWTYRDSLDMKLLKTRIESAGIMSEWKTFAALAVEYLGMPADAMPLYGANNKWSKKAQKVMAFIMETGNFGNNRDYSYRQKYPFVVFKAISLWRHLQDFGRYFVIFPLDAVKVTWHRMILGFSVALRGKRHE